MEGRKNHRILEAQQNPAGNTVGCGISQWQAYTEGQQGSESRHGEYTVSYLKMVHTDLYVLLPLWQVETV